MSTTTITDLPDECLSHILSFTSALDVVQASLVSTQFLAVSDSDAIWSKFLPSNLEEIVSQSSTPLLLQQFNSKKDLYLRLCSHPVLLDDQTQSFGLNPWDGKICYMLGARALKIVWGDTPHYWSWRYLPESRFPDTAELVNVCWLLVEGNINPKILSTSTTYGAYFVYKMDDEESHGFAGTQVKTFMFEVHHNENRSGHHPPQDMPFRRFYLKRPTNRRSRRMQRSDRPIVRDDGWMEIEMGKYIVTDDSINEGSMLRMTLLEIESGQWKGGLVLQGIELRPLD